MSSFSSQPATTPLFPYTTLFRSKNGPTPRCSRARAGVLRTQPRHSAWRARRSVSTAETAATVARCRSEEHTSELQSHSDLVFRLLLEKKNKRAFSSKLAAKLRNR